MNPMLDTPILYFRPTEQAELRIRPRQEQQALLSQIVLPTPHARLIRVYRTVRGCQLRRVRKLAA